MRGNWRQVIRHFKIILVAAILSVALMPGFTMAKTFDFSDWGTLLKKYVDSKVLEGIQLNTVNYEKLRQDPLFSHLLNKLKLFVPSELQTHEEKLAFWINTYNIFAIKIVAENYPLKSIKDIGSLFKSVWRYRAGTVGDKGYTLNKIEHKILRTMGEPRIHVAIVCASISCPDLATDVFRPESIDQQLDAQVRVFLANSNKGMRLDANGNRVFISKIFKWFSKDFESHGGVLKFIEPYVSSKYKQVLNNSSLRIFYMKYNWRLNDGSL